MHLLFSGKTITEAVKIYTTKCAECSKTVPSQNMKFFTEYFFSSFFTHYKLYQYVFTVERQDNTQKVEHTVEIPPVPEQFASGTPSNIWEYENKIKEMDEAAEQRKQERELQVQTARLQTEQNLRSSMEELDQIEGGLTREV